MRNVTIKSGDLVPVKIRKEVYEQCINYIEDNITAHGLKPDDGLCMQLYCILWDLENYLDNTPSGEFHSYMRTSLMFPELTSKRLSRINHCDGDVQNMRLEILKEMIQELN